MPQPSRDELPSLPSEDGSRVAVEAAGADTVDEAIDAVVAYARSIALDTARFWTGRDLQHQALEARAWAERDEAVGLIDAANER